MTVSVNSPTHYWCYYGLGADPFVANVDEKEIYLPASWEQYFDLLHHFCRFNNVLLAVTGRSGSGKTTFLKEFIQQFKVEADIVSLTSAALSDSAQVARVLAKEFSLPLNTDDGIEEQLEKNIINLQYKFRSCLLVIDDAHLLTTEALGALFYLIKQQSQDQMRLHVLLVGEPVLAEKLTALIEEETERSLLYCLSLAPFNREQTCGYLQHRLVAAGLPAASPFTLQDVARIHDLAEGVPLRINTLAKQILNGKIRRVAMRPRFQLSRWIIIIGILLLVTIAIAVKLAHKPPIKIITPPPTPAVNTLPADTVPAAVIDKAQQVITHVVAAEPPPQKERVGSYTVQVASSSGTVALEKFMAAHAHYDSDNYFYHYDAKNNRYLLLYGQYATLAEAREAVKALPPELQELQPWVRKIP